MAIYTMYIARAKDPLSGTEMDMYAVVDESDGNRELAYCPRSEDAERIKALLVYHGDQFPAQAQGASDAR